MRAVLPFRGDNRPLLIAAGGLAALALLLSLAHVHKSSTPLHETRVMAPQIARPATPPADTGIAGRIAKGERAFSIRVAEDEIVGGFLQSGDHVDVFATIPGSVFSSRNAQDQADRSQAMALLQNILVLAVGETLATKGAVQPDVRTVSLSLSPGDLARLALAQRYGKIALAIRAPGDDAIAPPAHAVLADIVPEKPVAEAPLHAALRRAGGIPFYSGTHRAWSAAP